MNVTWLIDAEYSDAERNAVVHARRMKWVIHRRGRSN
jgi:hypothetical protein